MAGMELPELIIRACSCGNRNPSPDAWEFIAAGYKEWSEANGVPMVPILWWAICKQCGRKQTARVATD